MAEELAWGTTVICLAIAVEGLTEEEFVKKMMRSHLAQYHVCPRPFSLEGSVSRKKLVGEMLKLSLLPGVDAVTSLVDFYGFSRKSKPSCEQLEEEVDRRIQDELKRKKSKKHVFPYIQRHEFEGLLFSDTTAFKSLIGPPPPDAVAQLTKMRAAFDTPEDINDGKNTAPSKRIQRVVPRYNKVKDGTLLVRKIGLETIREACPRFGAWVTKMESLASKGGVERQLAACTSRRCEPPYRETI